MRQIIAPVADDEDDNSGDECWNSSKARRDTPPSADAMLCANLRTWREERPLVFCSQSHNLPANIAVIAVNIHGIADKSPICCLFDNRG